MSEDQYNNRLEDRSPYWVEFTKEWLPQNHPGFWFIEDGPIPDENTTAWKEQFFNDLHEWYKYTRVSLREKVCSTPRSGVLHQARRMGQRC
jgi:hypothetical protein